jgi:N-acetylmuramoyl-L-alanine amidase
MNPSPWICLAATVLLTSCAGPLSLGGRGHSEYGDRAGAQGFSTVIIDAGHGGKDSGARGRLRGTPEKTVALDIAQRLQSELRGSFRVSMTRSSDVFVPLDDRVAIANRGGDAVLVSIHLNDGPRRLSGPETYWWRVDSYSMAKRVHSSLCSVASGSNNRGLVRRRLRLTRNPDIPCILVECGYLSNATDSAYLATASYRQRIAQAIARALREQTARGDAGYGPLPRPIYAPPSSAHDARE